MEYQGLESPQGGWTGHYQIIVSHPILLQILLQLVLSLLLSVLSLASLTFSLLPHISLGFAVCRR